MLPGCFSRFITIEIADAGIDPASISMPDFFKNALLFRIALRFGFGNGCLFLDQVFLKVVKSCRMVGIPCHV